MKRVVLDFSPEGNVQTETSRWAVMVQQVLSAPPSTSRCGPLWSISKVRALWAPALHHPDAESPLAAVLMNSQKNSACSWHKAMPLPWGRIIFRYGPSLSELEKNPQSTGCSRIWAMASFWKVVLHFWCLWPILVSIHEVVFPHVSCQAWMWHSFPGVIWSF